MAVASSIKGPVPIGLILFAVLGWLLVIYLLVVRATLGNQLEAQVRAAGTVSDLQQNIAYLETQSVQLLERNRTADEELAAKRAQLDNLQAEVTATVGELQSREAELQRLEAALAPLREELQTFDTRLAEVEQRLASRTEELAAVGDRLTEARASEAEVQGRLATLSETAARLTAQTAEAEQRAQAAREAEASLQAEVVAATTEMDQIRTDRERLATEVAELTARRDRLLGDNQASAEQRNAVQALVTELSENLAARSGQLAELERRIAQLQASASQAPVANETEVPDPGPAVDAARGAQPGPAVDRAAPVEDGAAAPAPGRAVDPAAPAQPGSARSVLLPGEYRIGTTAVMFAEDGTFTLADEGGANGANQRQIAGRYEFGDGTLTLLEGEGDLGAMAFPMACALAADPGGALITDKDGTCAMLAGETLSRLDGEPDQSPAPAP